MNSPIIIAIITTIVTIAIIRSRDSASRTLQINAIFACAELPWLADACGDRGGTALEPACCVAGVDGTTCNSPTIPTSAAENQAMAANVTSASTH